MKLEEQYDSLIKTFDDPCPDRIYHYTSAEGLRGIIENSEIWLTNVAFVNDKTECRALQNEKDLFTNSDFTCEYLKRRWNDFIKRESEERDTYIASFSTLKGSLDQWRAYGTFCIGFDAKELLSRVGFYFYQCVYHKNDIKKWILEKSTVQEWKGSNLNDEWKSGAAYHLIYIAATRKFKHWAFEQENEVRIIAVSHPTWEFPNSPSLYAHDPPIYYRDHPILRLPVPYVKLFNADTNTSDHTLHNTSTETCMGMKDRKRESEKTITTRRLLPIKEVVIGSMAHQREAKIACEMLLKDKGYDNVVVDAKDIPFRGF